MYLDFVNAHFEGPEGYGAIQIDTGNRRGKGKLSFVMTCDNLNCVEYKCFFYHRALTLYQQCNRNLVF
jgi:hypothetical protein